MRHADAETRKPRIVRLTVNEARTLDRDGQLLGDAMVCERLLMDDCPKWAELHYDQVRVGGAMVARGLTVDIEELE